MKLTNLRNKLNEKEEHKNRINSIKKSFIRNLKRNENNSNDSLKEVNVETYRKNDGLSELNNFNNITTKEINPVDNVKIIGITGSKGKSTTSYIVNEYLKLKGKKTILYSSIQVDSPTSIKTKSPLEVPLSSENTILDIIDEAESYNADYVVLEVNESAIEKGLVKDIPFAVRALTNIIPDCNLERYDEEEYLNIKKSFFKDLDEADGGKCVIGLTTPFTRETFNEFLKLNNLEKVTYAGKEKCEAKNADFTNIDVLHFNGSDNLNGISFNLRVKDNVYTFHSNLLLPHNIDNITCAAAIIDALDEFDSDLFQKLLDQISIPGREEIIKVNGRTIVIGVFLVPILSILNKYKNNGDCKKIKVVCGMAGTGFKTWLPHLSGERRKSIIDFIHRDAMYCVRKNADFAYLTSNDPAASNPMEICLNLQRHINNVIPSNIVINRKEAIKQAILESEVDDVIYISGRGNREKFCVTESEIEFFTDKEIVMKTIKELGW